MMASLLVFVLLGALPFISANLYPSSDFNCSDIFEHDFRGYGREWIKDMSQVYEILGECPEIKSLRLKHYTYYGEAFETDLLNFKFRSGHRFPQLRELSLNGYDFGDFRTFRQQPKSEYAQAAMKPMAVDTVAAVDTLDDRNLPLSQHVYIPGANLEPWSKVMDWAALHELKLSNIDNIFFWKMTGRLPGLTDLVVHDNRGRSNVSDYMTDFITALNPLSNLSTYGYTGSVDWSQVLKRHGSTLERLEIQEWNTQNSEDSRSILSLPQIEEINRLCPLLSELSVNVNTRNLEILNEKLTAIASFENLTKLTIRLRGNQQVGGFTDDLSYDDADYPPNYKPEYEAPFMSTQTVLKIFQNLRLIKKGAELKQLDAYVGNHEINYGGKQTMLDWTTLENSYTTSHHSCSQLNDKGERKAEGEAWCQCEGSCKAEYPRY